MTETPKPKRKTAATTKERHGEDFYRNIAKKTHDAWVKNGRKPRGFEANPELAKRAGKKGGEISKRRRTQSNG